MTKHRNIKTTKEEIVTYWMKHVDECDLSVDWSEAKTHCWRCGCERTLERCHIIPDALGGKDVPENLVLLCPRCHAEGPNVTDPEIMWDWIKAYKVPFYNTFWAIKGMEEYEFIYGSSLLEDIKEIVRKTNYPDLTAETEATVKQVMDDVYKEASVHFGQPHFNTATVAGMYRIMLKRIAEKINSETQ